MLKLPDALTLDAFLEQYWQKRPLILRAALSPPDLAAEDLAGLACEPGVESRIVIEHGGATPWEVHYGPFDEAIFSTLPQTHWTLLVQDMDKHLPEVADLLREFRFVPDWRIDDIMISYAADQGSVGPHTDAYDVFLIQAHGRRRWQIHTREVRDDDLISGLDLRILKHFEAEQEWVLEPGDVLYLPPGVAHWGVALGESMTWSVGFRAPSAREMAADWLESRLQSLPDRRYGDADLIRRTHPGELGPDAVDRLRHLVETLMQPDPDAFARWACGYVTETKEHLAPLAAEIPVDTGELARYLRAGGRLHRLPAARMLFHRSRSGLLFAAGGEVHELQSSMLELARAITDIAPGESAAFEAFAENENALSLLADLIAGGHLEILSDEA